MSGRGIAQRGRRRVAKARSEQLLARLMAKGLSRAAVLTQAGLYAEGKVLRKPTVLLTTQQALERLALRYGLDVDAPITPASMKNWADRAWCKGQGVIFIAKEREDESAHLPHEFPHLKRARFICAHCPVREPCMEFGMQYPHDPVIYAGLTPADRRRLRKERAKEATA